MNPHQLSKNKPRLFQNGQLHNKYPPLIPSASNNFSKSKRALRGDFQIPLDQIKEISLQILSANYAKQLQKQCIGRQGMTGLSVSCDGGCPQERRMELSKLIRLLKGTWKIAADCSSTNFIVVDQTCYRGRQDRLPKQTRNLLDQIQQKAITYCKNTQTRFEMNTKNDRNSKIQSNEHECENARNSCNRKSLTNCQPSRQSQNANFSSQNHSKPDMIPTKILRSWLPKVEQIELFGRQILATDLLYALKFLEAQHPNFHSNRLRSLFLERDQVRPQGCYTESGGFFVVSKIQIAPQSSKSNSHQSWHDMSTRQFYHQFEKQERVLSATGSSGVSPAKTKSSRAQMAVSIGCTQASIQNSSHKVPQSPTGCLSRALTTSPLQLARQSLRPVNDVHRWCKNTPNGSYVIMTKKEEDWAQTHFKKIERVRARDTKESKQKLQEANMDNAAYHNQTLLEPIPNENHTYCQVCNETYSNYIDHVQKSETHRKRAKIQDGPFKEIDSIFNDLNQRKKWQNEWAPEVTEIFYAGDEQSQFANLSLKYSQQHIRAAQLSAQPAEPQIDLVTEIRAVQGFKLQTPGKPSRTSFKPSTPAILRSTGANFAESSQASEIHAIDNPNKDFSESKHSFQYINENFTPSKDGFNLKNVLGQRFDQFKLTDSRNQNNQTPKNLNDPNLKPDNNIINNFGVKLPQTPQRQSQFGNSALYEHNIQADDNQIYSPSDKLAPLQDPKLSFSNPQQDSNLNQICERLDLESSSCNSEANSDSEESDEIDEQVRNSLAKTALHHVDKPLVEQTHVREQQRKSQCGEGQGTDRHNEQISLNDQLFLSEKSVRKNMSQKAFSAECASVQDQHMSEGMNEKEKGGSSDEQDGVDFQQLGNLICSDSNSNSHSNSQSSFDNDFQQVRAATNNNSSHNKGYLSDENQLFCNEDQQRVSNRTISESGYLTPKKTTKQLTDTYSSANSGKHSYCKDEREEDRDLCDLPSQEKIEEQCERMESGLESQEQDDVLVLSKGESSAQKPKESRDTALERLFEAKDLNETFCRLDFPRKMLQKVPNYGNADSRLQQSGQRQETFQAESTIIQNGLRKEYQCPNGIDSGSQSHRTDNLNSLDESQQGGINFQVKSLDSNNKDPFQRVQNDKIQSMIQPEQNILEQRDSDLNSKKLYPLDQSLEERLTQRDMDDEEQENGPRNQANQSRRKDESMLFQSNQTFCFEQKADVTLKSTVKQGDFEETQRKPTSEIAILFPEKDQEQLVQIVNKAEVERLRNQSKQNNQSQSQSMDSSCQQQIMPLHTNSGSLRTMTSSARVFENQNDASKNASQSTFQRDQTRRIFNKTPQIPALSQKSSIQICSSIGSSQNLQTITSSNFAVHREASESNNSVVTNSAAVKPYKTLPPQKIPSQSTSKIHPSNSNNFGHQQAIQANQLQQNYQQQIGGKKRNGNGSYWRAGFGQGSSHAISKLQSNLAMKRTFNTAFPTQPTSARSALLLGKQQVQQTNQAQTAQVHNSSYLFGAGSHLQTASNRQLNIACGVSNKPKQDNPFAQKRMRIQQIFGSNPQQNNLIRSDTNQSHNAK